MAAGTGNPEHDIGHGAGIPGPGDGDEANLVSTQIDGAHPLELVRQRVDGHRPNALAGELEAHVEHHRGLLQHLQLGFDVGVDRQFVDLLVAKRHKSRNLLSFGGLMFSRHMRVRLLQVVRES